MLPARRPRLARQNAFSLSRFPSFFADQPTIKYARLRYSNTEAIPALNLGAINIRTFRANDVFDPDHALGGHQPYGFDQLMAMYQHFTVLSSKVTVEVQDTAEYKNAYWQISLASASGEAAAIFAAGGINGIIELPRHSAQLGGAIDGARESSRSISLAFNARSFFHKSNREMIGNTTYSGDVGHSPAEDAYFEVVCYSPIGAAVSWATSGIRHTVDYDVAFSEPRYFAPS